MINKLKNNAELICIIPAAGKSSRYDKSNKIFESLEDDEENGLDVLNASILNINTLGVVTKIYVGYDESSKEACDLKDVINNANNDIDAKISSEEELAIGLFKKISFVKGGSTRQETVYKCLQHIKNFKSDNENTWVLVHDAARPCVFPFENLEFINKTIECDTSSIMAIPISDTVKKVDADGKISNTLPRENLWLAQTPQMFKFNILYESLKHCNDKNISVTDDSQALEILGHQCRVHMGKPYNNKITYHSDLPYAKCIYEHMYKSLYEDGED